MHYQFNSKIAVDIPQKKGLLQKFFGGVGLLAALGTVATAVMEGFHAVSFLSGFFVPAFLIYSGIKQRYKTEYVTTPVTIDLSYHKIEIRYPALKHFMGMDVDDTFVFLSDYLEEIQYSSSLSAIRFYGIPSVQDNGCIVGIGDTQIERVVYLPAGEAEKMCHEIEQTMGITVEFMDE